MAFFSHIERMQLFYCVMYNVMPKHYGEVTTKTIKSLKKIFSHIFINTISIHCFLDCTFL